MLSKSLRPLRFINIHKALMLNIILFISIWFSINYLVSRSLNYYRAKLSYFSQKKSETLQEQIDCVNLKAENKKIKNNIISKLKETENINANIALRIILNTIFGLSLNISQFKPGLIIDKGWYTKNYLNLDIYGSYYDLAQFFTKLGNLAIPIKIKSCALSEEKDKIKENIICKAVLKFYLFKTAKEPKLQIEQN